MLEVAFGTSSADYNCTPSRLDHTHTYTHTHTHLTEN